jgi:3-oxoacyl-[acyl-carrier protein] reductase
MRPTILITGVSRKIGIGASVAIRLASLGYNIYITYYRSYDHDLPGWKKDDREAALIAQELMEYPVTCGSFECDLADVSSISRLFTQVEDEVGPVYGLINNACFSVDTTLDSLTATILDQHYYINIRAPMLLAQAFVTRFRKQKVYRQGRIITLSPGYETEPNPGNLAYSATKAAINRFTNSLALEVASLGITVNAVDPGPTDTGWMDRTLKENLLQQAPMKRLGEPDDVANLIEFLISEKSQWITGQILHSRGGF